MKNSSEINFGMNKNTYHLLFTDTIYNRYCTEEELKRVYAINTIEAFTMCSNKKLLYKFMKLYYNLEKMRIYHIDFDRISYNSQNFQYEYQDKDLLLTFYIITDIIQVNAKIRHELTSNKREGQCHYGTLILGRMIANSKVLTGYSYIGNKKIFHSVLEVIGDNKNLIFDWTFNICMFEEDYYNLTRFTKISEFDSSNIIPDYDILENIDIGIRPYIIFRNEIMHDLERNSFLFEKTKKNS